MSHYQHEVPSSCNTTVYLSQSNQIFNVDKKYSFVTIALMVVELFEENNLFWWILGSWLEFDSIFECTRKQRGTQFRFFSTNRSASWLDLTQLVNAPERRWNTISDFYPPHQIRIIVLEYFWNKDWWDQQQYSLLSLTYTLIYTLCITYTENRWRTLGEGLKTHAIVYQ